MSQIHPAPGCVAVLEAASRELAVLDDRLWAGASDEELVEGIVEFQALKA